MLNLYSKFKDWCLLHRIPIIAVPIALFLILATALFFIWGSVVGVNFGKILTSGTAVLVYAVFGTVLIAVLLRKFVK